MKFHFRQSASNASDLRKCFSAIGKLLTAAVICSRLSNANLPVARWICPRKTHTHTCIHSNKYSHLCSHRIDFLSDDHSRLLRLSGGPTALLLLLLLFLRKSYLLTYVHRVGPLQPQVMANRSNLLNRTQPSLLFTHIHSHTRVFVCKWITSSELHSPIKTC